MERFKSVSILLICFFLFFFACYNLVGNKERGVVSDTTRVVLYDTIAYYKPIAKDSIVVRYIYDKLKRYTTIPDTITDCSTSIVDSVNVVVPIEQKVYSDSLYTAYVSGYRVNMDSIMVYPQREVVTIHSWKKPKRWSIGVQAGYGLNFGHSTYTLSPYIGIGISYNILNF